MSNDQGFTCLVINLDGSTDRWDRLSEHLNEAQVTHERISAVDGRKFDLASLDYYDTDRSVRYMGRGLVGGEIGCYLSHVEAVRTFLDLGGKHCLVLEDDSIPDRELVRIVHEVTACLGSLDPDWRIVNLGNPSLKISTPVRDIQTNKKTYTLCKAFYFPMTTGAILWSRKGAEDFLSEHGKLFAPIDNYLRHWITRAGGGYAFSPRPVETTEAESEIANAPRSRNRRSKLYGLRKQRRLLIDKWIALRHKLNSGAARG